MKHDDFVRLVNNGAAAACVAQTYWFRTFYLHYHTDNYLNWKDTFRCGAMNVGYYVRQKAIQKYLARNKNRATIKR